MSFTTLVVFQSLLHVNGSKARDLLREGGKQTTRAEAELWRPPTRPLRFPCCMAPLPAATTTFAARGSEEEAEEEAFMYYVRTTYTVEEARTFWHGRERERERESRRKPL